MKEGVMPPMVVKRRVALYITILNNTQSHESDPGHSNNLGRRCCCMVFLDRVVLSRSKTQRVEPITQVAPEAKIKFERAPWQKSIGVFLMLLFFTVAMWSIASWKKYYWANCLALNCLLLLMCSYYYLALLSTTKKPFKTCIRKAYFNYLTFVTALFSIMWLTGYFDQK